MTRNAQRQREWYSRHREQKKKALRTQFQTRKETLAPSYVRQILVGNTNVAKSSFSEEMVALKTAQLKLRRILNRI